MAFFVEHLWEPVRWWLTQVRLVDTPADASNDLIITHWRTTWAEAALDFELATGIPHRVSLRVRLRHHTHERHTSPRAELGSWLELLTSDQPDPIGGVTDDLTNIRHTESQSRPLDTDLGSLGRSGGALTNVAPSGTGPTLQSRRSASALTLPKPHINH